MCRADDADPWEVFQQKTRKASKPHTCEECQRTIAPGEAYQYATGRLSGFTNWETYRTCAHCVATTTWMSEVCGGYLFGGLLEELVEHWDEGYKSVGFGRLIIGVRRRWHDGGDPVPDAEQVRKLAVAMMHEAMADWVPEWPGKRQGASNA